MKADRANTKSMLFVFCKFGNLVDLKADHANTNAIDESKAEHKDEREVVEQRPAAISFSK